MKAISADRPPKVAFYMTTILEHGGGLEKYYIETAGYLARQGIATDVITMDESYTVRIANLLSVFYGRRMDPRLSYKLKLSDIQERLKPAKYRRINGFKNLRQTLNEYDVVYSKNELLEAFILKYFVGFKKIPPVMFGGHTPLKYPRAVNFHAKLHNFLYTGPVYRYLANRVSGFHCLNTYELNLYQKLFPKRPVNKIYNPFDAASYRASVVPAAGSIKAQSNKLNVLWVGRLTEQKGVDRLCKLINEIPADLQNQIAWHIVGNGELRETVDQLAGQHSNVHIYGYIDAFMMPKVYHDSDALIFTSKWEGYPYTLLEASAFDLPILAYSIPGVTDILGHYPYGRSVEDDLAFQQEFIAMINKGKPNPSNVAQPLKDEFKPDVIYRQILKALGGLV